MSESRLGLPTNIQACLFDLDGVLTETATIHANAWKRLFDDFLFARARATNQTFVPFDIERDYDLYVDGRPRDDGTRSFLAARGIHLPEGTDEDLSAVETVKSLGKRKNAMLLTALREQGVEAYPGSMRYVRAVKSAGLLTAVVSSSTNCREVLVAAGIEEFFDARVDGTIAAEQGLPGKPAPDTYLAAARMVGSTPADAAVFEDAIAGVSAGRAGGFGFVVGVDRVGQSDALRRHGADVVVTDLAALLEAT